MSDDVFHPGERLAQRLAGFSLKGAPIRSAMSDQHRSFFAMLPIVFLGLPDGAGWPVATALTGPPGFIDSPDPVTLDIGARLGAEDPAAAGFAPGAPAGLLGLEFATRRRNRANGTIRAIRPGGWTLAVRESFGNCPQYIQTRTVSAPGAGEGAVERLAALGGPGGNRGRGHLLRRLARRPWHGRLPPWRPGWLRAGRRRPP